MKDVFNINEFNRLIEELSRNGGKIDIKSITQHIEITKLPESKMDKLIRHQEYMPCLLDIDYETVKKDSTLGCFAPAEKIHTGMMIAETIGVYLSVEAAKMGIDRSALIALLARQAKETQIAFPRGLYQRLVLRSKALGVTPMDYLALLFVLRELGCK